MATVIPPNRRDSSRASVAVARAMVSREHAAHEDVERILQAALAVLVRVSPESPRVSDIVTEAGTTNHTFYRYFESKDDVILALMERGVARVETYLVHLMEKDAEPVAKIERWVRGVVNQIVDRKAAEEARAVLMEIAGIPGRRQVERNEMVSRLRGLLVAPLKGAGSTDSGRDADAIHEAVMGTVQRHQWKGTTPSRRDVDHLVAFCVRAITREQG